MNFTFTLEQANLILAALGELPAKHTMALIAEIQKQASAQAQDAVEPSKD